MSTREKMLSVQNPFELILDELESLKMMVAELKQQQPVKPQSGSQPDYLSVSEAAEYLGVSTGSIYRYVMLGTLPKKKFGNKLYFSKALLQALIEKGVKP